MTLEDPDANPMNGVELTGWTIRTGLREVHLLHKQCYNRKYPFQNSMYFTDRDSDIAIRQWSHCPHCHVEMPEDVVILARLMLL